MTQEPAEAPLRIAMVCLHTDPFAAPGSGDVGGMNVVVRHTAAAIAAAGHRVRVFTRRDGQVPERETVDGVLVRRLRVGPEQTVPKSANDAFIEPFGAALAASGGPGSLRDADVVHSHHWFSGMAALPLARDAGIPHVQSFHSIAAPAGSPLREGEPPESAARPGGEMWLARQSDRIIAVSRAERDTCVARLGASPDRIDIVHPGVDPLLFHPDGGPRPGRPRLLVAARLEPLKAVDLAIRALAGLIARRPAGAPRPLLQVAGGATRDADLPANLLALARELGVGDDVELLGAVDRDRLATLMRRATLVLIPSHSETYGLVALEAAASGIPVVAASAGGLLESVRDGVTGTLVQDWRTEHWVSAVADLLDDEPARAAMGAAGRRYAQTHDWTAAASATIASYRALLTAR